VVCTIVQTAKMNDFHSEADLRSMSDKTAAARLNSRISELMPLERKVITTVHPSRPPSFGGIFASQPRHRLFLGIWTDAYAAESLTRLIEQLRDRGIMPERPVDTNRLHLTLHHLGDLIDQVPPSLLPGARAAAATVRMQPFDIVFDRIGGT